MSKDALNITDQRNDKTYEAPIELGTIRAMDLRQIKTGADDFGLMTYDPAFMNTASCKSAITYIDGDKGILRYRGYPIEVLAERCTFLEVAYLLLFGELPTEKELSTWVNDITHHTMLHETTKKFMEGFRYSSHPMAMFVSTIAALSSVYPDAKEVHDPANRMHQIVRLIGKVPSIAAMSYRHNVGFPYVYPDNDLQLCRKLHEHAVEDGRAQIRCQPGPRACARHSLHSACRSRAELQHQCHAVGQQFTGGSVSFGGIGGVGAGRAPAWRRQRRSVEDARRDRIEGSRPGLHQAGEGGAAQTDGLRPPHLQELRSAGENHRWCAEQVFEVTGRNPKLDIALELERIALEDDYFVKRKLYPNVDFYSGIIYQAMGFQPEMFTVLFAIPRTAGGWRSGRR